MLEIENSHITDILKIVSIISEFFFFFFVTSKKTNLFFDRLRFFIIKRDIVAFFGNSRTRSSISGTQAGRVQTVRDEILSRLLVYIR